eukprot:COSAG02_NODE_28204_length_594_cov_0.826263_1_plen_138_part_10
MEDGDGLPLMECRLTAIALRTRWCCSCWCCRPVIPRVSTASGSHDCPDEIDVRMAALFCLGIPCTYAIAASDITLRLSPLTQETILQETLKLCFYRRRLSYHRFSLGDDRLLRRCPSGLECALTMTSRGPSPHRRSAS